MGSWRQWMPWLPAALLCALEIGVGSASMSAGPAAAAEAQASEELASLGPDQPLAEDAVDDALEIPVFTPRARTNAPKRPDTLFVTGETLAEQIRCLALNIYFEARSETYQGKKAVAAVTINRLRSPRFPKTICEVVRQGGDESLHRCQFSWWCDGRSDRPRDGRSWAAAVALAETVLRHGVKDPTRGALWYHADYVRPVWRQQKTRVAVIGRHIFYVDRRSRGPGVIEARR
ncbi:MAG: cell wall hydrolase [Rhodospirillales bacterium]|nr:cell wall hydrolase [Rhodospirillales bacterium]